MRIPNIYNINDLHLVGATKVTVISASELEVEPDGLDISTLSNSAAMTALRDAQKDAGNVNLIQSDRLAKLLFEVLFDQENRLRTLAGQPTITRNQYRNGLLTVWRNL